MMLGEPQKARVDIANEDFSGSAELVLDLVMSYLPLKDCVRTSVLSSRWRYRWTTIPSLVFDTTCCPRSCTFNPKKEGRALVSIVNRVLSLHNGSIQVFQVTGPCVSPDVDCWIFRVSKDPIKTLVLGLWGAEQYKLPSSLFNCGSLSRLELSNCLLTPPPSSFKGLKNLKCLELSSVAFTSDVFEKLISSSPLLEKLVLRVPERWDSVQYELPSSLFTCGSLSSLDLNYCLLRPPSSFKGFKNLKCLQLYRVTLTNDAFGKLISSCPLLEDLELSMLDEADNLKINAPNLQDVFIIGDFNDITFEHPMTRLSAIHINAPECSYTSLLDFSIKLPNIQRLELNSCDMGYMSGNSMVGGFPFECKDLYHLAISMEFSFTEDGEPTLYLYRSSSNLTKLHKEGWEGSYLAIELGVWEGNNKCHDEFEKLQCVNVDNFCGKREELEFVEFVLGNSPVLEKMSVNTCSNMHLVSCSCVVKWEDVKSIYGFKRASDQAKIIFDGLVTQVC